MTTREASAPDEEWSDDSEDEDYAPDQIDAISASGESDEEDASAVAGAATTTEARSPGRRKHKDEGDLSVGHSGGGAEDGVVVVKTRSKHALDDALRKDVASIPKSSGTDVDALWAAMNAPPVTRDTLAATPITTAAAAAAADGPLTKGQTQPAQVNISRTYEFAGTVHVENKIVARDSREASEYFAAAAAAASRTEPHATTTPTPSSSKAPPLRRVMKRKSILDASDASGAAKKINTLEASRMEWSSFVDREGIHEDLRRANENGYLDKQDFLHKSNEASYSQWKAGQQK